MVPATGSSSSYRDAFKLTQGTDSVASTSSDRIACSEYPLLVSNKEFRTGPLGQSRARDNHADRSPSDLLKEDLDAGVVSRDHYSSADLGKLPVIASFKHLDGFHHLACHLNRQLLHPRYCLQRLYHPDFRKFEV